MCNAPSIRHALLPNECVMLNIMANAHNPKMIKFWCVQRKVMFASGIEGIRWMVSVSGVLKSLSMLPHKQTAVSGWIYEYNVRTFSRCSRRETAASSWIRIPREGWRTAVFSDVTPIHNLENQSKTSVTPILSTPKDNFNNLNVSIAVWSNPKCNLTRTWYSLKSVSLWRIGNRRGQKVQSQFTRLIYNYSC
jgi:hypothetical protein